MHVLKEKYYAGAYMQGSSQEHLKQGGGFLTKAFNIFSVHFKDSRGGGDPCCLAALARHVPYMRVHILVSHV